MDFLEQLRKLIAGTIRKGFETLEKLNLSSVASRHCRRGKTRIMNGVAFSADNEKWPLIAALTWIVTRSLKYAEAFASRDIFDADALLALAREGSGPPPRQNYGEAFDDLCRKIAEGKIRGRADRLKWRIPAEHEPIEPDQYFDLAPPPEVNQDSDFRPQDLKNQMIVGDRPLRLRDFVFHDGDCMTPIGRGYGSPNPDGSRICWSWRGAIFSRDDLFTLWPDWPCFTAWKKAKAQSWRPPKNLSPLWLNNISLGQYIPLAEVTNLLAFGPDLLPVGLDATTEGAARLSAALALFSAATEGKVAIIGHATYRLPHPRGGVAPVAPLSKIEPGDLRDITLVIDGAPYWIGPKQYADEYPERGLAPESVSYVDVAVQRDSLCRWLAELSNRPAPQKRGRKVKFDWPTIEAEVRRLMNHHGEFSPDDPEWNAQARLESTILEYCQREWDEEPSKTQLRSYLQTWLSDWRKKT